MEDVAVTKLFPWWIAASVQSKRFPKPWRGSKLAVPVSDDDATATVVLATDDDAAKSAVPIANGPCSFLANADATNVDASDAGARPVGSAAAYSYPC